MKKGALVLFICMAGIILFAIGLKTVGTENGGKEKKNKVSKVIKTTNGPDENKGNKDNNADSNIWNRIRANVGGSLIAEMSDDMIQDDWLYHVNFVEVTKEKGNWENPDWSQFSFDEKGNLINEYSFVKVNVTIKCMEKSEELWLNHLRLSVYNGNAEEAGGCELSTASLEKPMGKDFFYVDLKKDEEMTVDCIYIVEDDLLIKENYFLLSINNTGMSIAELSPEDHSYIKITGLEEK